MKFREIFARWQLGRLRRQTHPTSHSFPADLLKPKHVLVCLPGSLRELTLVKQFLPTISAMFRTADITLLAMPGVKIYDIYPRRGYQILTPSVDNLSWSGVPKKSFINMLQENKFDMLLDLNLESSFFTSAILLNFPNAIKVGRGNHLGSPYYNLEIKTKYLRDERNIYRSLLETLENIVSPKGDIPKAEVTG
jgi:hypothetical protein